MIILYLSFERVFVCFRTIVLIVLFSQYLTKFEIPVPGYSKERGGFYSGRYPLFRLFPVSIALWIAAKCIFIFFYLFIYLFLYILFSQPFRT